MLQSQTMAGRTWQFGLVIAGLFVVTASAATAQVAGCAEAYTDLSDNPANFPARCEAGAPAPRPLAEMTKVVVTIPATSVEWVAPILYGVKAGEFEKDGIDLDVQVLPFADALTLARQGQVDVMVSGAHAAYYNAVAAGAELRHVMAGEAYPAESQVGVWAPDGVTAEDLKGQVIGSGGVALATMYGLQLGFEPFGYSVADVTFNSIPTPDMATAIENKAVAAGVLVEPYASTLAAKGGYHLVVPLGPRDRKMFSTSGVIFGPRMLENPEIGTAFVRAYIRTINTYFQAGYKQNDALVAELAEIAGSTPEKIKSSAEVLFNWEIPRGYSDGTQNTFRLLKVLQSDAVLTEDQVVDRSFVESALGIEYPAQ